MGEATVSAAASEAATDPSWTDVVSALGAVVAALAAVATVIVAVVAALYAKRQVEGLREQLTLAGKQVEGAQDQLKEARTLRREQAQPYVVVYAVPSRVNPQM